MTNETATEIKALLNARFSGVLTQGAHAPNGAACLHEFVNVAQGREWSDDPHGMPDLRGLNDAPWSSDQARTDALLPVAVALWDFEGWSDERKRAWARRVASETIRRVLPIALRAAAAVHPDQEHRDALTNAADACVKEGSAWAAAESAEAESAESAAWAAESARSAAWAAAESAESAAWAAARAAARSAARSAAADEPLRLIAAILVEAAEATK